ncbi:MAG: LacI family DNA-binding transcriptional regulator [Fidelibacterota bacterium]|jgi:DNA-binding LacI/PurR family transcriptional regulator|tara:strand:- start:725 stop:1720 length:996 start_codon:yes stop_codon:yes gene_type:complete
MRITLKHIANDTGLSIATVSRALSRQKRTHSTSEEKIYSSARKLGYPIFKNPGENQQLSIALVMKLFEGEFYASLMNGFYKASASTTSEIIFSYDAKHLDDTVNYIINLSKKYSGICLFLPSMTNNDYLKIKEGVGQYPIISLLPSKNPKIDTVCFDSYRGGYMLAKHFEEQGYKKFGFISGPSNRADALFRKNGFLNHINESDDLELAWSFEGDFSSALGKAAFADYKNTGLKDIAIFGGNDYSCFGFMKAAIESGYKIPNDFIIAGYDNLSFCETFTPELTSIATDFHALANKSIRIIENMIADNSDSYGNISMIPVKIKIRNSTNSTN